MHRVHSWNDEEYGRLFVLAHRSLVVSVVVAGVGNSSMLTWVATAPPRERTVGE